MAYEIKKFVRKLKREEPEIVFAIQNPTFVHVDHSFFHMFKDLSYEDLLKDEKIKFIPEMDNVRRPDSVLLHTTKTAKHEMLVAYPGEWFVMNSKGTFELASNYLISKYYHDFYLPYGKVINGKNYEIKRIARKTNLDIEYLAVRYPCRKIDQGFLKDFAKQNYDDLFKNRFSYDHKEDPTNMTMGGDSIPIVSEKIKGAKNILLVRFGEWLLMNKAGILENLSHHIVTTHFVDLDGRAGDDDDLKYFPEKRKNFPSLVVRDDDGFKTTISLAKDNEGDMHLCITDPNGGDRLNAEIVASNCRSPRTFKALEQLMLAIKEDNDHIKLEYSENIY